jgi:inner membrane transporter RhtA
MYRRLGCYKHGIVPVATTGQRARLAPGRVADAVTRLPPVSFFLVSAVFHYLGPSLAFLLFARVGVYGVVWLRIASAAAVFALWRRPWRLWGRITASQRRLLIALGALLAAMNTLFYLAVDRLPLATVGAIEFLGTVILAAAGARTLRNLAALVLAVGGAAALTNAQLAGQPLGLVFAFANCAGFMLYVILAHQVATTAPPGPRSGTPRSGHPASQRAAVQGDGEAGGGLRSGERGTSAGATRERAAKEGGMGRRAGARRRAGQHRAPLDILGAAMLVAAVAVTPAGIAGAGRAFTHPDWLLWGIGVGVCSSVIPYVTDQLAMARLPRATFALMLALLPAAATVIGLVVLRQVPTLQDLLGIGLVIGGVALHHDQPRNGPQRSGPAHRAPAGHGPARSQVAQERVRDGRGRVGTDPAALDQHGEGQISPVPDEPGV